MPPRALGLSLFALAVAALASVVWPESLNDLAALVWLLALVPAFLLAYYRGWQGAADGLLVAMILLIAIEIVPPLVIGTDIDWRIAGGVAITFIAGSLGAGTITESLRQQQTVALELAHNDPLTGLANRRMLELFLRQQFAMAQRGRSLSVVLFDLDQFKVYNDTYGHAAGDDALRAFADVLRRQTRGSDLTGRYGGEEFLTMLPQEGIAGARLYAERVRDELARLELPTGDRITVSAGLAAAVPLMESPADLLKAADHALYTAKGAGGNRVEPGRTQPPGLKEQAGSEGS